MNVAYSLSIRRTFAADVIVQFTLRLLADELFPLSESDVSRSLCGAFIFVCRQMYNTCEGLQILRPFGLHHAIAAAWRKVPAHKCSQKSVFFPAAPVCSEVIDLEF